MTQRHRRAPPSRRSTVPFAGCVAQRRYRWRPATGRARAINVEIGTPVKERGAWACRVRISGLPLGGPLDQLIYGVDAMQALELAMSCACSLISQTPQFRAGEIEVWGQRARTPGDLRLPLALNDLRDTVVLLRQLIANSPGLKRNEEWRREMLGVLHDIARDLSTAVARLPSAPRLP